MLHERYKIPHIVITSVSLKLGGESANTTTTTTATATPAISSSSRPQSPVQSVAPTTKTMSVVGSSMTSDLRPRLFKIRFPVFDGYFSGTGDMFAALMVTRMREAVYHADSIASASAPAPASAVSTSTAPALLSDTPSWLSPDSVPVLDLPLARAAEKVLASMHEVLARTCASMAVEVDRAVAARGGHDKVDKETVHLLRSKAAELRLSRNLECLRDPKIEYRAERM